MSRIWLHEKQNEKKDGNITVVLQTQPVTLQGEKEREALEERAKQQWN
jgi:polyisoprenoid-binding protein YceI